MSAFVRAAGVGVWLEFLGSGEVFEAGGEVEGLVVVWMVGSRDGGFVVEFGFLGMVA